MQNPCSTNNNETINYNPFGMGMPTRSWSAAGENYRFGFNGQEQDDEIYGNNNATAAEFWEYDPRLGRRCNIDIKSVQWESPYATFRNNPIVYNDINGASPGNPGNDPTPKPNSSEPVSCTDCGFDTDKNSIMLNQVIVTPTYEHAIDLADRSSNIGNKIHNSQGIIPSINPFHDLNMYYSMSEKYHFNSNEYAWSNQELDKYSTEITFGLLSLITPTSSGALGWGLNALKLRGLLATTDMGIQFGANLALTKDPISALNYVNLTQSFLTFVSPRYIVTNSIFSSAFEMNLNGHNTIFNNKSSSDFATESVIAIGFGLAGRGLIGLTKLNSVTYNTILTETQISLETVYGPDAYSIMFKKGLYARQGLFNILSNENVIDVPMKFGEKVSENILIY